MLLHVVGDWAYWFFGLSGTGPMYAWWSGPGSDIAEVTVVTVPILALWRHFDCREPGCWRWALRELVDPATGERLRVCHKHHPHGKVTSAHLADVAARMHAQISSGNPTIGT